MEPRSSHTAIYLCYGILRHQQSREWKRPNCITRGFTNTWEKKRSEMQRKWKIYPQLDAEFQRTGRGRQENLPKWAMQRNRGNRRDAWPSLLPAIGTCSSADTSVRKSGSHLAKGSLCLLCSRLPFDQILLTVFTPTCRETADSPTLSAN